MANVALMFEIGALERETFRRAALSLDLKVREERGFFDSAFRVTGPYDKVYKLRSLVQRWAYLDELLERQQLEEERQRKLRRRWWQFWKKRA